MSDEASAAIQYGDSWLHCGTVEITSGDESRVEGDVEMHTLTEHPVWGPQIQPSGLTFDVDADECVVDDLRDAVEPGPLQVEYAGHTFEVVSMHQAPIDEVGRDDCDDQTVALVEVPGGVTLELAEWGDDTAS